MTAVSDTTVRDREEIKEKLDDLHSTEPPETPVDERDAYGIDQARVQHNAMIDMLEHVLEATDLSYESIYELYKQREDLGFTLDRDGTIASIRITGEQHALEWVLNDDNPSDPRTVAERLDHITEEITHLDKDFRQTPVDELVDTDTDVDADIATVLLSNAFQQLTALERYLDTGDVPDTVDTS